MACGWARAIRSLRAAPLLLAIFSLLAPRSAVAAPGSAFPTDAPGVGDASVIRVPPVPTSYEAQSTRWLTIAYPPSIHERIQPLLDGADATRTALAAALDEPVLGHVEVRIARSPDEMAALAPTDLPPPAYASGVAYSSIHLVILSLIEPHTAEATDLEQVFRHELTHVALEDATLGHHVPRWFNEGLAIHESGEDRLLRFRTLVDATMSRTILPLDELDCSFPSEQARVSTAYAESADFVRYLLRGGDRARFASLIERVRKGEPFDRALADSYATDLRRLEYQWREELGKRYSIWPLVMGGSFLWISMIGLCAVVWVKKKRHERATLARWALEDARSALVAPLQAEVSDEPNADRVQPEMMRALPKIEHEGHWHTLH